MRRKRTAAQISYNMSRVGGKDSVVERRLRSSLFRLGLRYRLHCKDVPGKPDVVFRGAKLAVFVDSEFWHGYDWERNGKRYIKSNRAFWIKKIERNIARDREVTQILEQQGWRVRRFWGREILKNPDLCALRVASLLGAPTSSRLTRSQTL